MKYRALQRLALLLYGLDQIRGYSVLTLAGSGTVGWLDGVGTAARFNGPHGLALDNAGNLMVADFGNHRKCIA